MLPATGIGPRLSNVGMIYPFEKIALGDVPTCTAPGRSDTGRFGPPPTFDAGVIAERILSPSVAVCGAAGNPPPRPYPLIVFGMSRYPAGSEPAPVTELTIAKSSYAVSTCEPVLTLDGLMISSMLPYCTVESGRFR